MKTLLTFLCELRWIEFLVEALSDFISFKIKAYAPILLSEAYRLAANFEKQDRTTEPGQLEKRL